MKALNPKFITGRETDKQKDEAAAAFMEGKTDLLCISLRSASGLNLQRATCVVFGELDWSPAVHSQAEDRAHRIGQQDSLLCYYLVSPKGSDRDMQDALGLKVSQFVAIMGDAPPAGRTSSSSRARPGSASGSWCGRLRRIALFDSDSWYYAYYHRDPWPIWQFWNPTRVFPEVFMPVVTEFSAHVIYPLIGDYFFSLTIGYATVVSAAVALLTWMVYSHFQKEGCNAFECAVLVTAVFNLPLPDTEIRRQPKPLHAPD